MITVFHNGTVFTYGILLLSVVALGLFCNRVAFLYFRLNLNTDDTLQRIVLLMERMNYRGAIEECVKIENHPLGRTLKAGLLKFNKKDKDIERAMEEKILREAPVIKAGINYMGMFAIISILLGFLGTVVSLINSLSEMSQVTGTEMIMRGISQAMVSIAFGLVVAIPCLIGYFILNNRGNYIIAQLKEKALSLFNTLSTLRSNA
ncbi:MAG: MotA/TolQ/ExbB proton channel family protein [bacterium]